MAEMVLWRFFLLLFGFVPVRGIVSSASLLLSHVLDLFLLSSLGLFNFPRSCANSIACIVSYSVSCPISCCFFRRSSSSSFLSLLFRLFLLFLSKALLMHCCYPCYFPAAIYLPVLPPFFPFLLVAGEIGRPLFGLPWFHLVSVLLFSFVRPLVFLLMSLLLPSFGK